MALCLAVLAPVFEAVRSQPHHAQTGGALGTRETHTGRRIQGDACMIIVLPSSPSRLLAFHKLVSLLKIEVRENKKGTST